MGILGGVGVKGSTIQGFFDGMKDSGFIEGKNITYDVRTPGFQPDIHREILEEFIENGVAMIFVYPTETALLAKELAESAGIPVVFAIAFTEHSGLIETIEAPGGTTTGIRYPDAHITLKRYEIFKELLPNLENLAVIYGKDEPVSAEQLNLLRNRAEEDHVTLVEFPSKNTDDLAGQLKETPAEGRGSIDAVLQIADAFNTYPEVYSYLNAFCSDRRIPLGGQFGTKEIGGSLFSVSIDFYRTGRQAAFLTEQILRGAPAGEIPVLSSEMYIVVNHAQAEELGLDVPQAILAAADEIIAD